MTAATARSIVAIAASHVDNDSFHKASAKFNLDRAVGALADRPTDAAKSAIRSLEYSVGVFHSDLKRAKAIAAS